MLRVATTTVLALAASLAVAAEPFDVSLDYSPSADLSGHYRAVVQAATQRYRGDGTGTFVVSRSYIHGWFGRPGTFETEWRFDDPLAEGVYLFRTSSSGTRELLAEAHFSRDPFPEKSFTLRGSP